MNRFEDPMQFVDVAHFGDLEIRYSNLLEISQGGPAVGNLSINGQQLQGLYGGPILCHDTSIFAPSLVKKLFGTGFRLAKINVLNHEVEYLSTIQNLIFLDEIKDSKVFYFLDFARTKRTYSEF